MIRRSACLIDLVQLLWLVDDAWAKIKKCCNFQNLPEFIETSSKTTPWTLTERHAYQDRWCLLDLNQVVLVVTFLMIRLWWVERILPNWVNQLLLFITACNTTNVTLLIIVYCLVHQFCIFHGHVHLIHQIDLDPDNLLHYLVIWNAINFTCN